MAWEKWKLEFLLENNGKMLDKDIARIVGKSKGTLSAMKKKLGINKIYNTENFIKEAMGVHGDRFDYSKVNYEKASKKVDIRCIKHDLWFKQTPLKHKQSKHCCKKCELESMSSQFIKNQDKFISQCIEKHGDTYGYSKVDYKGSHNSVIVTCKRHGDFVIEANSHLRGGGCILCAWENDDGGYNETTVERNKKLWMNKEAIVYCIWCVGQDEEFYKVGITTQNTHDRFNGVNSLPYSHVSLYEIKTNLYDAYYTEKKIHKLNKYKRYFPSIFFGGHTECYSDIEDIEYMLLKLKEENDEN